MNAPKALHCPFCNCSMSPFALDGRLELDMCSSCGAVLFDFEEDARFAGAAAPAIANAKPALGTVGVWLCPRCQHELKPMTLVDAPFVWCVHCRVSIVRGEHLARFRQLLGVSTVAQRKGQAPRLSINSEQSAQAGIAWITPTRPPQILWIVAFFVLGVVPRPWFFDFVFTVPMHELGHSVAYWIGGGIALPTPWGFTLRGPHVPALVSGVSLVVLGSLGVWSWVKKHVPFALFIVGLLLMCLYYSNTISISQVERLTLVGGVAGEFLIPATLLSLFGVGMPRLLRWDFWRWPLGLYSALSLGSALVRWRPMLWQGEPLPLGSVMGGSEIGGDFGLLIGTHGFTEKALKEALAVVCIRSLIIASVALLSAALVTIWVGASLRMTKEK